MSDSEKTKDCCPDPNRPAAPALADAAKTQLCPVGGEPGGISIWDGFNWVVLPPPTTPGAVLTWGANGPYWANPG